MIALAGSILIASLLGSAHCAGMCGGFVCFVAGQDRSRIGSQMAYHVGRLAAYVALGAVAGGIGAGLDRLGAMAGLSRVSAVVAGALMVAWGAASLARARGGRAAAWHAPRAARVPIAAAARALAGLPPAPRALALGSLTSLLPCGWLYAFVATAAGAGSPWGGAAVMAAFWMGTVPVLVAVGLAAQRALGPLRRRLPALTAGVMIALGLLTAAGKFHAAAATSAGAGHGSHGLAAAAPACHAGAAHGAR
jgi:sulfite exporter TauE/SafE